MLTFITINTELKAKLIAETFGNFIKCYVALQQMDESDVEEATTHQNAFDILMAAQREKMSRVLPDKIVVRNKKDQLFNMLMMIEKEGLRWKPSEVDSGTASNALSSLCDAVWYIDGHHQTFAERNFCIPEILSSFVGYNKPENSKVQKKIG